MSATMIDMKFIYADLLTPSQLMDGDLIDIDGEIVEVISVEDDATGDNYAITYKNEFDEEDVKMCDYEDMFKLYVFVDDDEE
jgi:hypothetical protein